MLKRVAAALVAVAAAAIGILATSTPAYADTIPNIRNCFSYVAKGSAPDAITWSTPSGSSRVSK